jgi:hypothetical protein
MVGAQRTEGSSKTELNGGVLDLLWYADEGEDTSILKMVVTGDES